MLTFRELTESEPFDPATLAPGVPFTQAQFYGAWQTALHRKVRRFVGEEHGEANVYFQIIRYPLMRGKTYLYVPYGPVVKNTSTETLVAIKKEITRIAGEERAVFARLDFFPTTDEKILTPFFTKAPASTYHGAYFQPRAEWYLDLDKTEDELIANMHEKTRYSIRTAEKRDVVTEIVTSDFTKYVETFYELMRVTAKRDHFHLHEKKYYECIFASLTEAKGSYLSIARYGEEILVVDLIIVFAGIAHHVFGCSSDSERTRLPNYLAQRAAIFYAKRTGCVSYTFGGISTLEHLEKGWEGLTRFKRRFGGREVRHSAFFDVVLNSFWYRLYVFRKFLQNLGMPL